ncbi:glycoside hydrolase family 9 protein [Ideonella sp. 4Y16]|uniref:glycoside hydrolase family 9 protein n=1 Tax=Ideonella alba TaxID=2824118 RepID=UPI001B376FB9|nr:glycoside hydrolase family 9 protein [Ideonella alba]MBQ0942829.1 glycoside hydrolase family 9 protein [Ideonella alba]
MTPRIHATTGLLAACLMAGQAVAAPVLPEAIAINQVGFTPLATKQALLPATVRGPVEVIDLDSGRRVLSRWPGPARHWAPAGQAVRLVDLSALRQPGRYRLRAAGVADSPSWRVDPQAYVALNAAAIRAFTFNRASIALTPEVAGRWARAAGHPDTEVLVHASAAGPSRPEGSRVSSPGGWYDAGDYNKYVVNSAISVATLLLAQAHFPAFFATQRVGLPDSTPGQPDLVQELRWNLDWMLSMQDPTDGGVYHKLSNAGFDGVVMPAEATAPRYLVAKSSAAALDLAATAALAARVLGAQRLLREGEGARLRLAAERAWTWAQSHPRQGFRQPEGIHTGGYGDEQLDDEQAWAAAELFALTGEARYRAALDLPRLGIEVPGWNQVSALAWLALADARTRLPAPQRALPAQRLRGLADTLAARWRDSAAGVSLQVTDFGWGSNGGALNQALVLLQSARQGGPRAHLDAAQALLDHVLGRNLLGHSQVTGFGSRSPQHPHHRPSMADGIDAPVPGFVVGGPNAGRDDAAHCPVPYARTEPALAWLDHDCSYASNEVAINWNAPLVYVTAALQVLGGRSR